MKLKVYGWRSFRADAPGFHHQTREVCAAKSQAEVARIAGVTAPYALDCLCETGNEHEVRVAMAEPGVIFWRGINENPDAEYRRG